MKQSFFEGSTLLYPKISILMREDSSVSMSNIEKLESRSSADGFVHIHDTLKYGLRTNHHVIPEVQDAYMIFFAHQLHCLRQLQTMLVGLASKNGTASFGDSERNHAEQCINYIRRRIKCSGDMTLEGPDEKQEVDESALRGWGVEHRCVDRGQMLTWVDQNATVSRY